MYVSLHGSSRGPSATEDANVQMQGNMHQVHCASTRHAQQMIYMYAYTYIYTYIILCINLNCTQDSINHDTNAPLKKKPDSSRPQHDRLCTNHQYTGHAELKRTFTAELLWRYYLHATYMEACQKRKKRKKEKKEYWRPSSSRRK